MNYNDYTLDNFLNDETFQAYVLHSHTESVEFWSNWIKNNPEKQEITQVAHQLISLLKEAPQYVSVSQKQAEVQKLMQRIRSEQPIHRIGIFSRFRPYMLPIAASIVCILIAGIYWQLFHSPHLTYTTAYGKTRQIQLTDGSVVMLNANSSLEVSTNWQQAKQREVWLSGEAFFRVTHQHTNSSSKDIKFTVHTADVDIEVLGTQFNVKSRNSQTQVMLNSGKVKLKRASFLADEQLILNPGEFAQLSREKPALIKKHVIDNRYSAWTIHKWVFDHSTLAEVVQLIEETYGLTVSVSDSSLLTQQVNGSIPNENLEILKLALTQALQVQIQQENNKLIIQKQPIDTSLSQ